MQGEEKEEEVGRRRQFRLKVATIQQLKLRHRFFSVALVFRYYRKWIFEKLPDCPIGEAHIRPTYSDVQSALKERQRTEFHGRLMARECTKYKRFFYGE